MDFANVTTDPAKDFGITYARGLYNDGLPQTVAGEPDAEGNPTQVPNPALSPSDSHYFLMRCGSMVDSWAAQALAANVTPPPPPGVVNGVPQTIAFRQAKTFMQLQPTASAGVSLWDAALATANAIADPVQKIKTLGLLQDSQTYERQRPELVAFAKAPPLNLTDADLDAFFVAAAAL